MCVRWAARPTASIGIRLDEGDYVVAMIVSTERETTWCLSVTEHGYGKRTEVEEYRIQGRGG
jgi:DNA gyrase subunit A